MTDKRIFAVSLSNNEPMSLLAGYRDGQLHIVDCKPLPRSLAKLKKTLPNRLIRLKETGFIVLVDEVMPVFGRYARSLKLSDVGTDGRPVLVSALQTYRNMVNLQAITFPPTDSGAFDISESIVEERRDLNGNISYHIDWSELRAESTLLLLVIAGAMQESLLDACTTISLLKQLGGQHSAPSYSNPFEAITRQYDRRFLSDDALGNSNE
ncbi:hypothetical protein VXS06_14510 [Photobacterium toruni]|uniref:Maturation control protein n=1 Tax=Photobacterium toruni TaxID=1935446 RepID=A0ABU6LDH2_9GAMM|nr:hypothetical protein [Photobacterium toruni]